MAMQTVTPECQGRIEGNLDAGLGSFSINFYFWLNEATVYTFKYMRHESFNFERQA